MNERNLTRELSGEARASSSTAAPRSPAEFWKLALLDWQGTTPLVVTVPPCQASAQGPAQSSLTLNATTSGDLRLFADQIGVPLGVLFHATWGLLIHRYSGEHDIMFGVVKGCPCSPEAESATHIVPSRVIFDSSNVRLWLRSLAAQAKETAPFETISLNEIRTAANVPDQVAMFESVLSVGHDSFDPLSIATPQPQADGETYPLVGAVYFSGEINLRVAYSPLRFSETAIKLLLGHWSTLLANLRHCVEAPVTSIAMLPAAEREQLLHGWNATGAPWPSTACVHQLFEQQVDRAPDAPAVMFGEEMLSYRELNSRANTLANHLRSQGIGPDSIVGLCVERSFDLAVSVLAVLKAGAAYLPLDPAYPHERLQFMLEDSHPAILLTQLNWRHIFRDLKTPVLLLDTDWAQHPPLRSENPKNATTPENLSYLIYTSGSTGKPKGVAMTHRTLVNLIDWQLKTSPLGAAAKTLQFASLSFDVSLQEIFSTWLSGGTLVLIPADLRFNSRELWNFIAREKITRVFLPFVALQQLANAAAAEGTAAEALREVVTAGEQLQVTPELREMFTRHPEATLHNHYGPSETHVVTARTLSGDPRQWPTLPSIGQPIQNTQIYLLDENREPVALGLPGELFIGGVALARGYFDRPDVTAKNFVRDPFREEAEARLYKTGDLARRLPDGEIEFLGRIDQQVKIRGYRVELGEIEATLNKLPAVRESVVLAREPSPGQKQLVAYLIARKNSEVDAITLRQELKQLLPDHMVPSAFVFLERFPLTSSGKVDRKSLPAPERRIVASPAASQNERPWLTIQFQLVQIWEEILGVNSIGIRDNFFELGGHSLLAVKMMDRVRDVTGLNLPVTALFEEATITHLAKLILSEEQNVPSPVIELQKHGARLPLYFLHGDIIGGGFYVREFSRLLGDHRPFYVLPPIEIPDAALPSVEEMALQHLRDLRAHRPHGPYLLGGFCVGGLIAYEMARRLSAAGEEVPFVALIDPELPDTFLRGHLRLVRWLTKRRSLSPNQTTRLFSRGHKFLFRLREEWNAPLREKMRFAAVKARTWLKGNGSDPALSVPGIGPAESALNSSNDQDALATFQWILSNYVPPRYRGPVTIFLTEEQESLAPFLRRKWQKAAPHAHVHRLAGRHLGSITTNVEVLAAKMNACLERIPATLNLGLLGWPWFLLNLLSHEPVA